MQTLLPPTEQYLVTTSEFEEMKERLAMLTRGRNRIGVEAGGPTLRKKVETSDAKDEDVPVLKRKD